MKMTKDKILRAIGNDAWDKIKKLAFGEKPEGDVTEATLADGTTISYTGTLAVGTPVSVISPEGELPIPDGEYEMEDGTVFTTKKGIVDTLTPAEEGTEPKDPKAAKEPKTPGELKDKIEAMRRQNQKNHTELALIKKEFTTMQTENKELRQTLTKISKVLEILVENHADDNDVKNRQFARKLPSKADRIAQLLKN